MREYEKTQEKLQRSIRVYENLAKSDEEQAEYAKERIIRYQKKLDIISKWHHKRQKEVNKKIKERNKEYKEIREKKAEVPLPKKC